MHLAYKTAKYKDKVYKSYYVAESYREGNKVKKRTIWSIGKLTETQKNQISLICKAFTDPNQAIAALKDIVVQESRPYLDLAIAEALWEEWKFSKAFKVNITGSDIPTPLMAKILTINKCVAPCSHYSIPDWVQKTALPAILAHDFESLNDDKIYFELDKIDQNQIHLENHLFQQTYKKDKAAYDFVNYDLSTSYFVGIKCNLSRYGKSKDDKPKNKQVLLGILVNDKGYPFKWDVYPGNTAEVKTLIHNVDACKKRFGLKNTSLVFDRGIVSDDNLEYITDHELKYVSALDKDQIPNIAGIELSVFSEITTDNYHQQLSENSFSQYDDELYYKDLDIINGRRYILGFNPTLFKEERKCRHQKITCFEEFIVRKNEELKNAKRSRTLEKTKQSVIGELKRLKIKKYFQEPVLSEIIIVKSTKGKKQSDISSFVITIEKKQSKIAEAEKLDGLCVFISNHIEKSDDTPHFSGNMIINAYREKTKIEDAFKHIKSFLKIRPFYVNLDEHVRAVYSICILAYFLNKDLAERRKELEGIDYLNSKNLYEPFRNCHYVSIRDKASGAEQHRTVELTQHQRYLLNSLNLKPKLSPLS
jgi:transposase